MQNDLYQFLDKNLYRVGPIATDETSGLSSAAVLGDISTGTETKEVSSEEIVSGEIDGNISFIGGFIQSKNFESGVSGWRLSADGTFEAINAVLSGSITATSGTIGGFSIGSDYIRDAGNSMGLASTVTGGDDVRFWAGDTYANRATAPFRVTESGALFASSVTIAGYVVQTKGSFGGDGSDGALSITSGTTTLAMGNVASYVKNYTSISITGTGVLAFSDPHANGTIITLKTTGDITITSSATPAVDVRSLGASSASRGVTNGMAATNKGANGAGAGATPGVGGSALVDTYVSAKNVLLAVGGGGGEGEGFTGPSDSGSGGGGGASLTASGSTGTTGGVDGSGNGAAVAGGRGGGCLYLECAGAYNVSGVINASGATGTSPGGSTAQGGGGGGAGGGIVARYRTLTSDTGTYTVAGGAGGTGDGNAGDGGAGAAGYSSRAVNNEYA